MEERRNGVKKARRKEVGRGQQREGEKEESRN